MSKLQPNDKVFVDRDTGAFCPVDSIDTGNAEVFRFFGSTDKYHSAASVSGEDFDIYEESGFRSDVEMALALSKNDWAAAAEVYEFTTFGALLEARAPLDVPDGP